MEYEGEFYFNKKWNGKGYDKDGNIVYEINNGNGKVREYNGFKGKISFEGEILNWIRNVKGKEFDDLTGNIIFEGEHKNGIKMGKEKNKTLMVNYYLKENI